MSNSIIAGVAQIDPWVASSFLQKAIRRCEVGGASLAGTRLRQCRGAGAWKRLLNIAFEDIGVAEPRLLLELATVATDGGLRTVAGSEMDLMLDIIARMARAPKDRSSDYLYTAATKWLPCRLEREWIRSLASEAKLDMVVDQGESLLRRAIAALELLTVEGAGEVIVARKTCESIFSKLDEGGLKGELVDATRIAASQRAHPVILMAMLLQQALEGSADQGEVVQHPLPDVECVRGIPLYVYDKYTSLGKRAIERFARDCDPVKRALGESVQEDCRRPVAEIAVFYAEGRVVRRQFRWSQSRIQEIIGRGADLTWAGCPPARVQRIVECVAENLDFLNDVRRDLASKRGD